MAGTYKLKLWALLGAPLLVAGCSTSDNFPLIFGQTQTVGLSIGGSTTDQGAELVLGFKDKNIAIIPVTIRQADGGSTQIEAQVVPGGKQLYRRAIGLGTIQDLR